MLVLLITLTKSVMESTIKTAGLSALVREGLARAANLTPANADTAAAFEGDIEGCADSGDTNDGMTVEKDTSHLGCEAETSGREHGHVV